MADEWNAIATSLVASTFQEPHLQPLRVAEQPTVKPASIASTKTANEPGLALEKSAKRMEKISLSDGFLEAFAGIERGLSPTGRSLGVPAAIA